MGVGKVVVRVIRVIRVSRVIRVRDQVWSVSH